MFLSALQHVGLYTLTSTPMGAEKQLRELTQRPAHERVFLLLPIGRLFVSSTLVEIDLKRVDAGVVGFPAADATVPYRDPKAARKPLKEVMSWLS